MIIEFDVTCRAGGHRLLACFALLASLLLTACVTPQPKSGTVSSTTTGGPAVYCDHIRLAAQLADNVRALNRAPSCKRYDPDWPAVELRASGWVSNPASKAAAFDQDSGMLVLHARLFDRPMAITDLSPLNEPTNKEDGLTMTSVLPDLATASSSTNLLIRGILRATFSSDNTQAVCVFADKAVDQGRLFRIDLCRPIGTSSGDAIMTTTARAIIAQDLPQIGFQP